MPRAQPAVRHGRRSTCPSDKLRFLTDPIYSFLLRMNRSDVFWLWSCPGIVHPCPTSVKDVVVHDGDADPDLSDLSVDVT